MILSKLINDEMARRNLSARAAAREVGIAHTTLIRLSRGDPADVDTLIKLCRWLNVNPSDVIDGLASGDEVAKSMALLLQRHPNLAAVFSDLLGELLNGNMTQEEVLDVINYANYKMTMRRANHGVQQQNNEVHEEGRLRT